MDDVSVIIPAYNRASTIRRAIDSARRQTLAPCEIIVVDDASSDDTAARVGAIGDPRLRTIVHPANRGAASARNTGVAAAAGTWVAFLDSDDEWEADKLAAQLAALKGAPDDTRASVTGYAIRDLRTDETRRVQPRDGDGAADLVWGCFSSPGSTLIVQRAAFDAVGPFDAELRRLEDWDWLMRYARRYRLGIVPQVLTVVTKGGDPAPADVADAVRRLRQKHRGEWYRTGWLAGRKFDSTLHVEAAAGAYYGGDRRRMFALLLRAIAAYPLRRGGFYPMLLRRAAGVVQRPQRQQQPVRLS